MRKELDSTPDEARAHGWDTLENGELLERPCQLPFSVSTSGSKVNCHI